jgi:hypothetical protein
MNNRGALVKKMPPQKKMWAKVRGRRREALYLNFFYIVSSIRPAAAWGMLLGWWPGGGGAR